MSGCCDPVGADEVARRLGYPVRTVYVWIQRGVLPVAEHTISGRPCWHWSTIRAWAEATGRADRGP